MIQVAKAMGLKLMLGCMIESTVGIAAAAHLSALDYLGEVPWEEHEAVKHWYALVKSRPSFRPLLQDRVAGFIPAGTYADLDF